MSALSLRSISNVPSPPSFIVRPALVQSRPVINKSTALLSHSAARSTCSTFITERGREPARGLAKREERCFPLSRISQDATTVPSPPPVTQLGLLFDPESYRKERTTFLAGNQVEPDDDERRAPAAFSLFLPSSACPFIYYHCSPPRETGSLRIHPSRDYASLLKILLDVESDRDA